jgi:cytochrome c oxidase subunit 2
MNSFLANTEAGLWLPEQASTIAGEVDWLFLFILWICISMFVLIAVLLAVFIVKYRGKPGQAAQKSPSHSTALEMLWTVPPTIIVMVIFYLGFRGYLGMTTPPPNAYEIQVLAETWNWSFTYPNGHTDRVLHVPLNRPVRLIMQSQDVIHSLYVPAFRVKKDAVPGRYTHMWFQATKEGTFDLFCTEYCGQQHSTMLTSVEVQEPTVFAKWLEDAGNYVDKLPPLEAGKRIYETRGCKQCHSTDGTRQTGPSFKGLFGSTHTVIGGGEVTVDENHIRESILSPGAKVYQGFENVMPTYQGRMKDKEITVLIEYLKSLK